MGRCPLCAKPLTHGVFHRVDSLADRPVGTCRPNPKPFSYAIPLVEVLSEILKAGPATKRVQDAYQHLIASLGLEIKILSEASLQDIRAAEIPLLDDAIQRMREGRVEKTPGFDGQYGTIQIALS